MSTPAASRLRVLICEDSKTYSACLTRLLERDPGIEVVGVCESAEQTIARLPALTPDLVTMDLELPGMSGAAAIEQIMAILPVPILVLSGQVERDSHAAVSALAAGALDVMPKADLDMGDLDSSAAQALRKRVRLLCRIRVIRHPRAHFADRGATPASWARAASVIGVVASTGGPPALATMLAGLPATFPLPIFVVQHMSPGFLEGFARWLDGEVPLPVQLAVAGARPCPGVWVAPEGAHLVLTANGRVELDDRTVDGLHRPSGDMLLRSLAAHVGRDAVAVVLSGMGRDGADGLGEVQGAGGLTIAQDQATSAVYGMSRAAAECGAQLVLPIGEISGRLRALRAVRSAA